MLQVRLFGAVRVSVGASPFPPPNPPKLLLLWAYLLLRRAQALTRDQIAFTLWADESESDARANLRRHLYWLRQYLPPSDCPWFLSERDTVQWNPQSDYWLDVEAFENAAALSHTNPSRESLDNSITRLKPIRFR